MSTTVIGDKNIFALEYKIHMEDPMLMAYNCLWIQGKFLCNFESSWLLYGVYNQLSILVNEGGNFYETEFLNKTPEEVIEEVMLTMIPNFYEPEKKFKDFSRGTGKAS